MDEKCPRSASLIEHELCEPESEGNQATADGGLKN
jgi:hypothetical protein